MHYILKPTRKTLLHCARIFGPARLFGSQMRSYKPVMWERFEIRKLEQRCASKSSNIPWLLPQLHCVTDAFGWHHQLFNRERSISGIVHFVVISHVTWFISTGVMSEVVIEIAWTKSSKPVLVWNHTLWTVSKNKLYRDILRSSFSFDILLWFAMNSWIFCKHMRTTFTLNFFISTK